MSNDHTLFGIQRLWCDGKFCDKPVASTSVLPSSFQIGDEVEFELNRGSDPNEDGIMAVPAIVQGVHFTAHTVRYDLAVHVFEDLYAVVPNIRTRIRRKGSEEPFSEVVEVADFADIVATSLEKPCPLTLVK